MTLGEKFAPDKFERPPNRFIVLARYIRAPNTPTGSAICSFMIEEPRSRRNCSSTVPQTDGYVFVAEWLVKVLNLLEHDLFTRWTNKKYFTCFYARKSTSLEKNVWHKLSVKNFCLIKLVYRFRTQLIVFFVRKQMNLKLMLKNERCF